MRLFRKTLKLIILVAILFVGPALSQTVPDAPPSPARDALFEEAVSLAQSHNFEAAMDILLRLADENTGTTAGVSALRSAANAALLMGDSVKSAELRQRIIQEYPGTVYAFATELHIAHDLNLKASYGDKLEAKGEVIERYGGPNFEEIFAAETTRTLSDQLDLLDAGMRNTMGVVYANSVVILQNSERYDDALVLCKFGREAFAGSNVAGSFASARTLLLREMSDNDDVGRFSGNPTILSLLPEDGTTVSVGTAVSATVSNGDYRQETLDLDSFSFKIDGDERRNDVVVSGTIDTSLEEGQAFESISFEINDNLEPGVHTAVFEISATSAVNDPPGGPASASATWSFTVTDAPPNPVRQELTPTKDSTLRGFSPHRNEGANPRLFMGFGKSQAPVIGFDLTSIDLARLSKATLVTNIQDCNLPRNWGRSGRVIQAHPLSTAWTEGNGYNFQRPREGKRRWRNDNNGDGAGVTWFSPNDQDISNKRPNGPEKWFGARVGTGPVTAPPVTITNGQTGIIEFDVTNDLLNGYYEGWVLKKDRFRPGNIRFFSREAGDDVAPKLILEFGGPVAASSSPKNQGLMAGLYPTNLQATPSSSELRSFRELLRENKTASAIGEELVGRVIPSPPVSTVAQVMYRVWLS